ncbi:hypothetical protein QBC47DRAFT_390323 [Echria macrotheca]|uniref:CFEM domain-containing protein n=1 Tax=Echria macrotheca TaxID=438768 RepID=A0AAJ0B6Y4_9PEZI|nr:hypothetical protein QBC47DRAFT_390323 [Echria macrotheca]
MGFIRIACAVGLSIVALSHVATATLSYGDAVAALPDCSRVCLQNSIRVGGCNITDIACICPNEGIWTQATACVMSACTVRETLTTKNITHHVCTFPVEVDDDIVPALSVFIGLASLAVVLRILARVLTSAFFWWDDLCNFIAMVGCIAATVITFRSVDLGLGRDMWFVDQDNITEIVQIFYASMLLYTAIRFLTRASIILFYLRVFPANQKSKIGTILQYTMLANILYNLSFFFAVVFQCKPVESFWTLWERLEDGHKCGDVNALAWAAAITGIVFDAWLLALPFPQLMALQLHWKKKIMGGLMFSVGICVMIISLIRLKTIPEFTRAVNPTRDLVSVTLWSVLEIDIGVICPCLPSFRLILRRLIPRITDTTGYEMGTGPGYKESGTFDKSTNRKSGNNGGRGILVVKETAVTTAGMDKTSHDEGSNDAGSYASATELVLPSTDGKQQRT